MVYFLCVAVGLFVYSGTVNAMEVKQVDSYSMPTDYFGGHLIQRFYGYFSSSVLDENKDDIKKYPAQGITTVLVKGHKGGARIKLNITQITDENLLEEAVIYADKNILHSVLLNRDGDVLDIGLSQLDHVTDRNIEINLALKNYTKIVTHDVDTAFFSPIKSDALHISLSSDANMSLPSIKAKTIELLVKDKSVLKVDSNALVAAEDLIFIDKEGLASIALAVETKLLQAQSRGNGDMSLQGVATEQQLLLCEGSYFAFALKSQNIRIAKGVGKKGNLIQLCAQELISGYTLQKTNYDAEFNVPFGYAIQISPITEDLWVSKFIQ